MFYLVNNHPNNLYVHSNKAVGLGKNQKLINVGPTAYSDVSIKNIDILPNRQYIANTADSAQERYS